MTMSEFDTLRADLAALRADVSTLRTDIDSRVAGLRADMDVRFARLEAKIDEKPSAATIYQASLATFAGMFAVMVGTVVFLKSISMMP
jgi:hypothetical protein